MTRSLRITTPTGTPPDYPDWLAGLLDLAAEHGLNGGPRARRRLRHRGLARGADRRRLRGLRRRPLAGACSTGRGPASATVSNWACRRSPNHCQLAQRWTWSPRSTTLSTTSSPKRSTESVDRSGRSDALRRAAALRRQHPAARTRPSARPQPSATPRTLLHLGAADRRATSDAADLHAFVRDPRRPRRAGGARSATTSSTSTPTTRVVDALDAAGLELLDVRGAFNEGPLGAAPDEAQHIKRVYLARLP